MFCGNRGRVLRRGIAAFLLLILIGSSATFAVEANTEASAKTNTETNTETSARIETSAESGQSTEEADTDGEIVTTVNLEGQNEAGEEAVEEIAEEDNVIMFSQSQPVTAKTVYLYYNKKIKYESYMTHDFHVVCDGKRILAYCIEPKVNWGGRKNYTAVPYNATLMRKALYYCYGNPGYGKMATYLAGVSRKSCYYGNDGVYALCHIMLSYIYDGESDRGDAFKGCSSGTKKVVKKMLAAVKSWPDPPGTSELGLSAEKVEAEWNEEKEVQVTSEIKVMGTEGNSVNVPVPQGTTLISGDESVSNGNGTQSDYKTLTVGQSFHYTAPASVHGTFSSGLLASSMKNFQPYLISPAGKQDELFSISTPSYVSFSVEWADFGKVNLKKSSADESITNAAKSTVDSNTNTTADSNTNTTVDDSYYSLEGARYELYRKGTGKSYGTFVTDKNGEATLENIPYGEYYIKETEASQGYKLDTESHGITVNADSCTVEVTEVPQVPDIVTSASDKATGKSDVTEGGNMIVSDTVKYSGVEPGLEYKIEGRLMNKNTGEQVAGSEKQVVFTPEKSAGSLVMEYEINTRDMGGTTVVAFEKLYYGDNLIATHEDINNKAQSVNILKEKEVLPETGDNLMLLILLAGIGASILCGTLAVIGKNPGECD